jgi:hypothetical protein
MKKLSSVCRRALAPILLSAICLGALENGAFAQPASTANPIATASGQVTVLPYGVDAVLKMQQKGIDKDIILNYINNSPRPFHLSADAIIHLQSVGLPPDMTKAMLQRDGQLQQQGMQQQPAWMASAAANSPAGPSPVVTPTTPAPPITANGDSPYPYYGGDYSYYDSGWPAYAYYDYGWPYYGYYGYGWPGWYGRGGGWGRGYAGFRGGFGGFRGGVGGFRGGMSGFRGGVGGFRGSVGGGFGGFRGGGGGGFHGGGGGGHGGGGHR